MTRDCFEPRSALLGSGSPAPCRDGFIVGAAAGADAVGRFFADFNIKILGSVSRRRAALPKPTSAIEPAGQDLGAPLASEINGQYRSNGARMPVLSGQCCRSRSATFDRRIAAADHSRETGSIATACLARSSSPLSPTDQSPHGGDFPERPQIPTYWRLPARSTWSLDSRTLPRRTLWPFCLCTLKSLFPGNKDRLDLRLVRRWEAARLRHAQDSRLGIRTVPRARKEHIAN
jgi:hypothetical protein